MSEATPKGGMSVQTATRLEYAIIGLGVLALLLIFSPSISRCSASAACSWSSPG
jgi:hypothetical protein